jgi:hypothetical protein
MKGTSPSQARRRNKPEIHPLMPKPLKRQGPYRLGLRSISPEVEFTSILLNPVAYPGEIWLTSSSLLSTFHLVRTIAQWTLRLDVGFRCTAVIRCEIVADRFGTILVRRQSRWPIINLAMETQTAFAAHPNPVAPRPGDHGAHVG